MTYSPSNKTWRTTGTITASGQEVTWQCPGAAGAIVTISGTFTGTLSSVGGTSGIDGGRLLFKSRFKEATNSDGPHPSTHRERPSSPTLVTPNNLRAGSSASVVDFGWSNGTGSLGTPQLSQILPINGIDRTIDVERMLQPGEGFSYQVAGAGGGNVLNQLRVSMTFIWYEESVN